jgi:hypothetical protein
MRCGFIYLPGSCVWVHVSLIVLLWASYPHFTYVLHKILAMNGSYCSEWQAIMMFREVCSSCNPYETIGVPRHSQVHLGVGHSLPLPIKTEIAVLVLSTNHGFLS